MRKVNTKCIVCTYYSCYLVFLFTLSHCNDEEKIGCGWFEDDNCWKQSVETAYQCLPDSELKGTLNSEATSCTYEDGTEITFKSPIQFENFDYEWDFEITKNDELCMAFDEKNRVKLTTSIGVFEETSDSNVHISCPNGKEYKINGFKMLECDWSSLPGSSSSAFNSSANFSFMGAGEENKTVFNCSQDSDSK